MPVTAPADKRFRRSHVSPARRSWWPKVSWKVALASVVGVALLVAGLVAGVRAVRSSSLLTISRVDVRGNTRLSSGEVLSLLDGIDGRNMLDVDLEAWRARLLSSPWVADAHLRRVLPGTVRVTVVERRPAAVARFDEELYVIDERGAVIDQFGPNYAELDLPIVDGLDMAPPPAGRAAEDPHAVLAARLLGALQARPDLAARVSQVDVSDARNAVVLLKGESTLLRLGEDRFVDRLQSYVDLASTLRDRVALLDYVDLRFDERIYVRPQTVGRRRGE